MSIPDKLILNYFKLLTDLSNDEIASVEKQLSDSSVNPMELKKRLGVTLASMYASPEEAERARADFEHVFSNREVPEEMPLIECSSSEFTETGEIFWPKFLAGRGLQKSSGEARRLISQGGFYIDGNRQTELSTPLPFSGEHILKLGKRSWYKLVVD
jgi:tyrosyl-tRNA synthetase